MSAIDSSGVTVSAPTTCASRRRRPLRRRRLVDQFGVAIRQQHGREADAVQERMRAGAESQVLAVLPVDEVVLAAVARPRPVRDLVVLVAGAREAILRPLVVFGLHVGVGRRHAAAFDIAGERRAVLDGERIQREVLRTERERRFEIALPRRERLLGQPVDEVEVDVLEAGCACRRERVARICAPCGCGPASPALRRRTTGRRSRGG